MRFTSSVLLAILVMVPVTALAVGRSSAPTITTSSAGMKVKGAKKTGEPVPAFGKVDTNGDHFIEWKEAKAAGVPKATFQRDDYNHDGKLTSTDWKLVQMDMIHTATLPKPESTALPPVPASVTKSMHTPGYGTASAAATAPAPATSGTRRD